MSEGIDQDDFKVAGPSSGDITEGCGIVGHAVKRVDTSF